MPVSRTAGDRADDLSWRPFDSQHDNPLLPPIRQRPTRAERIFESAGGGCALRWIERGELCDTLAGAIGRDGGTSTHHGANAQDAKSAASNSPIEIVWTWVGLSSRLDLWRATLSQGERPTEMRRRSVVPIVPGKTRSSVAGGLMNYAGLAVSQFRDHGELRWSMRSVLHYLPRARSYTLVTTDLPTANADGPHARVGQAPAWLKSEGMRLVHHWSLFKVARSTLAQSRNVYSDDEAALRTAAIEWRDTALPTFDSLAIESQLPHLSDSDAEVLCYFNDDTFVLRPLNISDFWTPLFGPVLRLQADLNVYGMPPERSHEDKNGEWPSLGYAAYLLDKRFGQRPRKYVVHQSKTMSIPLLREVEATWSDELAQTAEVRFRGRGLGVNTAFIATHFQIERFRELLLWSFFVLRIDADRSGSYEPAERARLISIIKSGLSNTDGDVDWFERSTASSFVDQLRSVDIELPSGTSYVSSSQDGFVFARTLANDHTKFEEPHYPGPICRLEIGNCFGADDGGFTPSTPLDTFSRFAHEDVRCGDCLSLLLLKLSGKRGLSAFLPDADPAVVRDPYELSYLKSFDHPSRSRLYPDPVTLSRKSVAQMLIRYQHLIGDSPSSFTAMGNLPLFKELLQRADALDSVFLTVNDEIRSTQAHQPFDLVFRQWADARFPWPSPHEQSFFT